VRFHVQQKDKKDLKKKDEKLAPKPAPKPVEEPKRPRHCF